MGRLRWMTMLGLVACQAPSEPSADAESSDDGTEPGEPDADAARFLLVRASLDLRGIRPSHDEFEAVRADPGSVDGTIERFLQDERFAARVRDMFAPVLRTRIDEYPAIYEYPAEDRIALNSAIGEETLQFIAHVAVNDLPYTDLVLGEYTVANELLSSVWPIDYPDGEQGWVRAEYADGRPLAGVLSSNSLWHRYPSNGNNFNRTRANAVSRIFLCTDIFARPVDFPKTIDLTSEEAVQEAVRTNPACLNCHAGLDPLASFFYGFRSPDDYDSLPELVEYHPERERTWVTATGVAPGYFGQPGYSLRDLGQHLASDPRFVDCAVKTTYEALLGRPSTIDDRDALTAHREVFLANDLRLRPLIASIVRDPRYRGTRPDDIGGASLKLVGAELLGQQIEALTGHRMRREGFDVLAHDEFGLRSLAGGGMGGAAREPTPTIVLVQQRLAEAASLHVVAREVRTEAAERRFFTRVDLEGMPSDEEIAEQVRRLSSIVLEAEPSSEDIAGLTALWHATVDAGESPDRAWASVLSVFLRDPDLLLY